MNFLKRVAADWKKEGLTFNQKDDYGNTPLLTAVSNGKSPKIIEFLLENGADLTMADDWGRNALHLAVSAYNANLKIVKALVEAGADITSMNRSGQTVLAAAYQRTDNEEITAYLVSIGAK